MDSDIKTIMEKLVEFRDERAWAQFHNSKDLALALSIEASEVNELFLWKDPTDVDNEMLKEELADVFSFAFLLAHKHGFDVRTMVLEKIRRNRIKYPIKKARGTAKKYNRL